MPTSEISYVHGIPEAMRAQAVELYDQAFGPKFAVAVPDNERRRLLISASLRPAFAFAAIENGRLVGLAGYQTRSGSLTGGMTYAALTKTLGLLRGNWAAIIFSLYEREIKPNELLMDGIVVAPNDRGRGIGTQLLAKLVSFAKENELGTVRLDVIDTNPHAQRMYERNSFVATETSRFGYLRWLLGFGASTTMVRHVD